MGKLISFLFIVAALALSCAAQAPQKESLLIGPGDLIYIEVYDTPEFTQEVRVNDAGMARLHFVGDVKLAGLSPAAAGNAVEKALLDKQVMKHPQVTVKIEDYATQGVSIMGQVQTPGTYPIPTPQPILRVLSLAGGLTGAADRTVTISRHGDGDQKLTYYVSNNSNEALSDQIMVFPGDIVVVPRAPVVYVLGDVGKPGGYTMNTNDSHLTVLQAIAMAGSTNKTAVQSKIRLIRKTPQGGQQESTIKLSAMQKGKEPDMVLQPNDVLYVPFSWMKNMAVSASSITASTASAAIYAIH